MAPTACEGSRGRLAKPRQSVAGLDRASVAAAVSRLCQPLSFFDREHQPVVEELVWRRNRTVQFDVFQVHVDVAGRIGPAPGHHTDLLRELPAMLDVHRLK